MATIDITDRMETAIEKLTNLVSDIAKMIAVHEQRINQQEKQVGNLEDVVEKRREDSEIKIRDIYETIRSEDRNIIVEINKFNDASAARHEKTCAIHIAAHERLTLKITEMERKLWIYMGGLSVIAFILMYGPYIYKLFEK
jgi:ferritin-like metal-binding protein YciE